MSSGVPSAKYHTARTRGCSFVPLKSFLAKCRSSQVVLRTRIANANFPTKCEIRIFVEGQHVPYARTKIPLVRHNQRKAAIKRKICAPYFLTVPNPMPCTASNSASLLGAVVAILSSARSPKIRNAGTLLRLASLKRHARNACSMRCCSDPVEDGTHSSWERCQAPRFCSPRHTLLASRPQLSFGSHRGS